MATGLPKVEGQHSVRKIIGRVDVSAGSPSVGVGKGFTLVDVAPGQVKVVISKPGSSILGAQATVIEGTDATGHAIKVDAKVEASSVTFGVYKQGGAAASISASGVTAPSASGVTAPSASNVTLSTSNTYSDAAVKAAIDAAVDALAAKVKTAIDAGCDALATKVKTAVDAGCDALAAKVVAGLDLEDGILADNVGFYFEITVRDAP